MGSTRSSLTSVLTKLSSDMKVCDRGADLIVKVNKSRAHGAFQQHVIPELSQHIELFSSGSSVGCGGDEAQSTGWCWFRFGLGLGLLRLNLEIGYDFVVFVRGDRDSGRGALTSAMVLTSPVQLTNSQLLLTGVATRLTTVSPVPA